MKIKVLEKKNLTNIILFNIIGIFKNNYQYLKKECIIFLRKLNKYLKLLRIDLLLWVQISKKLIFPELFLNFLNLKAYSKTKQLSTVKIFDKTIINLVEPKIYPKKNSSILIRPDTNKFPEVYVAEVKNGLVRSKTNLVTVGEQLISPDLYDSDKDYLPEELNHKFSINSKMNLIKFIDDYEFVTSLDSAASFLSCSSANYAHWLTEVLPSIATFCSLKQFKNVPLIIDDELNPNIIESLDLIAEEDRQVFVLKKGLKVKVKKLYQISQTGYSPAKHKLSINRQGMYSPDALRLIRNKIFVIIDSLPSKNFPKKIYLKRNSHWRNLVNEKEIISIFIKNGFTIIELEKNSFLQQASIIKNARYISGPVGASFGNLIFASPDSEINILAGRVKNMPYWYWQKIALTLNLKVNYFLGKINNLSLGPHSDFIIDPKLILSNFTNNPK